MEAVAANRLKDLEEETGGAFGWETLARDEDGEPDEPTAR